MRTRVPPPSPGPGQGLPPPPPAGHAMDSIWHGRYASCVFTQEDFPVFFNVKQFCRWKDTEDIFLCFSLTKKEQSIKLFFEKNIAANTSNESCGISVIFTDEVGESALIRRSPPRSRPASLTEHVHAGLGVSNGKATLVVPNGCNPTTPPPDSKHHFCRERGVSRFVDHTRNSQINGLLLCPKCSFTLSDIFQSGQMLNIFLIQIYT